MINRAGVFDLVLGCVLLLIAAILFVTPYMLIVVSPFLGGF